MVPAAAHVLKAVLFTGLAFDLAVVLRFTVLQAHGNHLQAVVVVAGLAGMLVVGGAVLDGHWVEADIVIRLVSPDEGLFTADSVLRIDGTWVCDSIGVSKSFLSSATNPEYLPSGDIHRFVSSESSENGIQVVPFGLASDGPASPAWS